jgi:hypothetical protein
MDVSFGNNYSNTVVERTFFQNCDFKKKLYLVNAVLKIIPYINYN